MGVIKEEDLKLLPISKIRPSKLNNYEMGDTNHFLYKTIELINLGSTLGVIGPFEDGCYELMSGERRYHSCIEMNEAHPDDPPYDMVPVLIMGDKDTDVTEQKIRIEIMNLTPRNLSAQSEKEHRLNLYHLLEEKYKAGSRSGSAMAVSNSTVKDFSMILGVSERTAQMYQSIVKADKEVEGFEEIVRNENIPIHEASQIAKTIRDLSDEEKKEINSPSTKQLLAASKSEEERKEILRNSVLGKKVDGELNSLKEEMKKRKEEKKNIPDPNEENFQQTVSNRLEANDTSNSSFPKQSRESYSSYPSAEEALFDSHGIRSEYNDLTPNKSDDDFFYKKMIEWSQKLLEKDELSEKEQEVVEAFRKVVDKF